VGPQHLQGKVRARHPETARRSCPRCAAAGADVVVLIAHSGFERGETVLFAENTVARLAEVPGVDAILFGHSHGEFPGRFFGSHPRSTWRAARSTACRPVMPGFWGSHLGVIDLVLDNGSGRWQVVDSRAHLRPVHDRATRKPLVAPTRRSPR
jgi:2',3'-cyclic-nucleotide 2'-phosphodiesterase/3'-nucleotidase